MFREYTISIVVPVWDQMDDAIELLERNLKSILKQDYKNYEIVVSDDSVQNDIERWIKPYPVRYIRNKGQKGMANNTNNAIDNAKGDIVKILFQDDYFFKSHSLWEVASHFTEHTSWAVSGCIHTTNGKQYFNPHEPFYSASENTIGSPSVMAFRSYFTERFDPTFHWVLDLDLYRRIVKAHGLPKIINDTNVAIGIHKDQMTNKLTQARKLFEYQLLKNKVI